MEFVSAATTGKREESNDGSLFDYATLGPSPHVDDDTDAEFTTNAEDQAIAAAMRRGDGGSSATSADNSSAQPTSIHFPAVKIDEGTFKYVLIEATDPTAIPARKMLLVRGDLRASYHRDAARPTTEALSAVGWSYEVLGGGRIRHDPVEKGILVYGHSFGFPWQNGSRHSDTTDLLKQAYPEYTSITWTDEGY